MNTQSSPTTGTEDLPRWDLDSALGSRSLHQAIDQLIGDVVGLVALFDRLLPEGAAGMPTLKPVAEQAGELGALIEAFNSVAAQQRLVGAVLHGRVSSDSQDREAAELQSRVRIRTTVMGHLTDRLRRLLAVLPLDDLAEHSEIIGEHSYVLGRLQADALHRMSAAEEQLADELRLPGSSAWSDLNRVVSAKLVGLVAHRSSDVREEPVSTLRGLATSADRDVRHRAYDAEIDCWRSVEETLAATISGAKGEAIVLNRRRGWSDDLEPSLFANGIDRPVLEAMTDAVTGSLEHFRTYLRAKAQLLGHDQRLAWWDLFAPVGASTDMSWPEALDRVHTAFARFSPRLAALADRAIEHRWIDAGPRYGKVGGAFCMATGGSEARVLLNFDGSAGGMFSLAHELGHAYHASVLADRTPLQRRTPMALAETASVFCETVLTENELRDANGGGELALLELDLRGATQIVVDIHSRFRFEQALMESRASSAVDSAELCSLMERAQADAYGDALDPQARHPYMWAAKRHYFTPFYNWPYTFGLLFSLALYNRYREAPGPFVDRYDHLLADTGMADPAHLAAQFDIDLRESTAWVSSLDLITQRIDRFVSLANTAATPSPRPARSTMTGEDTGAK